MPKGIYSRVTQPPSSVKSKSRISTKPLTDKQTEALKKAREHAALIKARSKDRFKPTASGRRCKPCGSRKR